MSIFRNTMNEVKPYVPGKPIEDVMREYNLTDIIKLASNENPLGPSKKAIERMNEVINKMHIYPDGAQLKLRERLAEINNVDISQVLVGSGGEQIISLIAQTFINDGDEVMFASPSFALYNIHCTHMGAKSVVIDLKDDFSYDLDKFYNNISNKTKIIFLANPNNPTGNIIKKDELLKFIDKLRDDILLVLDEAYFEYANFDDDYLNGIEVLRKRKNTIVLRTFSKCVGLAGLRVGYIFSSDEIIKEISKIKMTFNVNKMAQEAALAALDDKEHLRETIILNKKSLDMMKEYFDSRNMKYVDTRANFIFVNINKSSREVYVELQKLGVIIRPGFLWGFENYIRVSSGTIEQTKKFIDALDKVTR